MSQLDKLAQEREFEKQALIEFYEKVAFEAGVQEQVPMTDEEKAELAAYLLSELQNSPAQEQVQEVPQGVPAQAPVDPQVAQLAQTQPAAQITQTPVAAEAPAEEFQQKVAETLYHSEMFGRNAARAYWDEMAKLAAEMSDEEESEDKSSPAFEMMAKERASKMKEDMEKKAAYEEALNQRALELLQSGQV